MAVWSERDPIFGKPFIDVDEWRDAPVRHRYLHGGFAESGTRFSMYLPEAGYQGRLIQHLSGGAAGSEKMCVGSGYIATVFATGAFLVESNQGWIGDGSPADPEFTRLPDDLTILGYRANVQVARYAAKVAKRMLGSAPRYRYLFGTSGGGNRTVNTLEYAAGAYHGGVAFGIVDEFQGRHAWSVWAEAEVVLRDIVDDLVDAADAGRGDPFEAVRTDEQRRALASLYRAGFPRGDEIMLSTLVGLGRSWMSLQADPGYIKDFWSNPLYAGPSLARAGRRIDVDAVVAETVSVAQLRQLKLGRRWLENPLLGPPQPGQVAALRLKSGSPLDHLRDCLVKVNSGPRLGIEGYVVEVIGDLLLLQPPYHAAGVIAPDDKVVISNAVVLAWHHYHRHATDPSHPPMGEDAIDGRPIWHQRPEPGRRPLFGLPYQGAFGGKMIMLQHLKDHLAWPQFADAYAHLLDRVSGPQGRKNFRLWWIDDAEHGPAAPESTRLINFNGVFGQSMLDLIAWVEEGTEPSPTTAYTTNAANWIVQAPSATARRGIQPVVAIAGSDSPLAAAVGRPLTLRGSVEVPPGAGRVVEVKWDFDGSGQWPVRHAVRSARNPLAVETTHTFPKRGTFFVTLKATSLRAGSRSDLHGIEALARARVVVS